MADLRTGGIPGAAPARTQSACDQLTASGDHAEAVDCGLLAIEAEPLRESAHRALKRARIAGGHQAQAVQQLRSLERQL